MSIKISDFSSTNEPIDNELRIGVLEKLLEKIINTNRINIRIPTQQDVEEIRRETAEELKRKHFNSGIENKSI